MDDIHLSFEMNHCEAYNLPISLLINFGAKKVDYKKAYNINHPDNRKSTKIKRTRIILLILILAHHYKYYQLSANLKFSLSTFYFLRLVKLIYLWVRFINLKNRQWQKY
jgi:hypothetical protein